MSGASVTFGTKTNCGSAETCVSSRKKLRADDAIISVCKVIFPIKAALHVSDLTGYPLRTVEYWFGGGRIPADALAILIRSEYGARFIAALMVDSTPMWWRKLRSYFAALDAMRAHKIAQKKLREAIDAEAELSSAIGRADALLVHDEDFMRPHIDAVRDMAGVSDRALGSTKRGK